MHITSSYDRNSQIERNAEMDHQMQMQIRYFVSLNKNACCVLAILTIELGEIDCQSMPWNCKTGDILVQHRAAFTLRTDESSQWNSMLFLHFVSARKLFAPERYSHRSDKGYTVISICRFVLFFFQGHLFVLSLRAKGVKLLLHSIP